MTDFTSQDSSLERSSNPISIRSARSAIDVAVKSGNWHLAVETSSELRVLDPRDVAGFVLGSEALWQVGKHDEAESLSREAVRRFPDSVWACHLHASLAGRRGDWVEAQSRWQWVRDRFPQDFAGFTNGAAALMQTGALVEAESLLRLAIERHPDCPDGWVQMATLFARRGALAQAAKAWGGVRSRFPNLVIGYGAGAEALIRIDGIEEADRVAREGVDRFPENLWIAQVYAGLAGRRGHWGIAAERWDDVRRRFPDDPLAYEMGGHSLCEAHLLSLAESLLGEAATRFPAHAGIACQLGETLMRREAWAAAVAHWEKVRRWFPQNVRGFLRGALALRHDRRWDDASKLVKEASVSFVGSIDVLLLELEGMLDGSPNPNVWPNWSKCLELSGADNPHFYTLTWRAYLATPDDPRAAAALKCLLTEPLQADPAAVPSLVRGLAGLLQNGDDRYRRARGDIVACLGSMALTDVCSTLPLVVRALLGLEEGGQVLAHLVSSWLEKPNSKLMRTLLSSYEDLQKITTGIESGIKTELLRAISSLLSRARVDAENLTSFEAYNALYFAYLQDSRLFSHLARALERRGEGCPASEKRRGDAEDSVRVICSSRGAQLASASSRPGLVTIRGERKLRIALCVSGQLRGYKAALKSWAALQLFDHEVTTFLHVWRNIGRQGMSFANEKRGFPKSFVEVYNYLVVQVGIETLRARFPAFYAAFQQRVDVQRGDLESCYRTRHVIIEDDSYPPFQAMSNPEKMYYKVQSAHEMAINSGESFDIFIRMRPDKEIIGSDSLDWSKVLRDSVREACVFCDYHPTLTPTGDTIVGDQFAAGSPVAMQAYANAWSFTKSRGKELYGFNYSYAAHVNFSHAMLYQGITAAGLREIEFGAMFDPEGLSFDQLRALALEDVGPVPRDDVDRLFLKAFEQN